MELRGFKCVVHGCANRSPSRKSFGGRIAAANDAGWLTWVGRKECDPGDVYCPDHRPERERAIGLKTEEEAPVADQGTDEGDAAGGQV